MAKESVWRTGFTSTQSTAPIFDYIKQMCADLDEQTEGQIQAQIVPVHTAMEALQATLSAIKSPLTDVKLFEDSQNASKLYEKTRYQFFIYDRDHQYEFVVFELVCNDMFPVTLHIDETIAQEIKCSDTEKTSSFEAFQRVFERIVQANKVVYIIQKLKELPPRIEQPEEDDVSTNIECDLENDEE